MPKRKMAEEHFVVLLAAQDGETDFGGPIGDAVHEKHRSACIDLLGYKFGERMLDGMNSRSVSGLTKAGEKALADYLSKTQS